MKTTDFKEAARCTFVAFVNGKPFAALADQCIRTVAQWDATKFGFWAGVRVFRKSASVYVYMMNADGRWLLCDSLNAKCGDDTPMELDFGLIKQLTNYQQ